MWMQLTSPRRAALALLLASACRAPPAAPVVAPPAVVTQPIAVAAAPAPASPPPAPLQLVTPANPQVPPLEPTITRIAGKPATIDLGGGWRATTEPAQIVAALGDEVAFTVTLRASRRGSGRPVLWPSLSLRILEPAGASDRDPRSWLPLQGGVARGVALAAPEAWAIGRRTDVDFLERQAHGSLGYATLVGPKIELDRSSLVEVQMDRREDRCELPKGLSATVEGRRVTVHYSSGIMSAPDWVRPVGDFVVRRISGRLTLIGFVVQENSDMLLFHAGALECPRPADASPLSSRWVTSAVVARFDAPEAGPIDLVIHASFDNRATRHVTAVLVE